jgi:hypothetical protein
VGHLSAASAEYAARQSGAHRLPRDHTLVREQNANMRQPRPGVESGSPLIPSLWCPVMRKPAAAVPSGLPVRRCWSYPRPLLQPVIS